MVVTVYRARARSVEDARRICEYFYRSLELHQEPGWLRGTCMWSVNDPRIVFIHEHWSNLAAYDAWRHSRADQYLHEQADPLLETPWEIDIYQD